VDVEVVVDPQARDAVGIHLPGSAADLGAVDEKRTLSLPTSIASVLVISGRVRFLDRGAVGPVDDGRRVGPGAPFMRYFPSWRITKYDFAILASGPIRR
jgi:hypothetical protein